MPQSYNIIDQLTTPGTPTLRQRFNEGPIRAHVKTNVTDYAGLKAYDPPRGQDGAIAFVIDRDAAGTALSTAALPRALIYVWIDDDLSNDNGTTILRPVAVANTTAGRWMQIQALT